jgi:shikimate dehydrogenase
MASRSPWLHEQEAQAQGLQLRYTLFDFDQRGLPDGDLAVVLDTLRNDGYCGTNVTLPFKQLVMPLLDKLDESAVVVGAVNTIAFRNGRMIGHNTDMVGFRDSVAEGLPGVAMRHVLQLGAGGAGAAVASALLSLGVRQLTVCDLALDRAEELVTKLDRRFGTGRAIASNGVGLATDACDGIVNATPMGMAGNPGSALGPELILARHWVADVVYFPLETDLLRIARAKGCRVLDGSGMVIGQAARAFEILTGFHANQQRMRESFFRFPNHQALVVEGTR